MNRLQKRCLITGLIAFVLSVIMAFFNQRQFFFSYLFAYMFWLGITLGSMSIALIHQLTGGNWGNAIYPFIKSSIHTLPLLAIFFIPILLGMHSLYEWSHADVVALDTILKSKSLYLNIPFFILRAVFYFLVWFVIIFFYNRWTDQQEKTNDPLLSLRLQKFSGVSLVLYAFTMTFAAFDWLMSLNPHWFSTIYGMMIINGQVLTAFAALIMMAAWQNHYSPTQEPFDKLRVDPSYIFVSKDQFWDLGKLLLTFIMIWIYLEISQLLIIWAGNLPEEIPWYLQRLNDNWQAVIFLLIIFHFTLPFTLLLSSRLKKTKYALGFVAAGILLMRLVDLFWLIAPEQNPQELHVHLLDFILPIALGGIWLTLFLWHYQGGVKSEPA